MLTQETRRRIDKARDILVGQLPLPSDQIELITIALIYKFMGDIDEQSRELGGKPTFFIGALRDLSWQKLISNTLSAEERVTKLIQGIEAISDSKQTHIPDLFKSIFKNAFLKFRDAQVLKLFLDEINGFSYDHSEELGNAFEYLLDTMGTQGQNGQFRTPRNIIEFIVDVVDPQKEDTILDPACGTAGFLISAYKHIMAANTSPKAAEKDPHAGDRLTSGQRDKLTRQVVGYDITPLMCRLSRVNMYLHHFANPIIHEYDTLTNKNRWGDKFDVILANPPFMTPSGGVRTHDKFRIAANRTEVLFADFILEHLNPNGRAGFIVPEGIIFQNTEDYVSLRKWLVNEAGLWAVVSLPAQIFQPYSGVKTSVIFVDRALARQRDDILLVNVENDGFSLNTNRTPISANDLPAALQLLTAAKRFAFKSEIPSLKSPLAPRLVPRSDFAKLAAYRSASAAWEFCRKFRSRADRLEKAAAEARSSADESAEQKAEKALAKIREEFPGATGLTSLPGTEAELRAGFEAAIKAHAVTYGDDPNLPATLTPALRQALDNERDYNLSGERDGNQTRLSQARWPNVSLGEVCTFKTGGTPTSTVAEYYENGTVPWLVSGDIHKGEIWACEKRITQKAVEDSNARVLPKDSVLIALNGQGKTRGTVALLRMEGATCNQSLVAITPSKPPRATAEFIFWTLRSLYSDIRALTGDNERSGLNIPILKGLQIPLPPLEVQKELVTEIVGYQQVITGARMVLTAYRPHIPIRPDWPVVELGEICSFKNGLNFTKASSGHSVKIIGVSDFQSNLYAPLADLDQVHLDEPLASDYLLRGGGILFVRSNGNPELVGRSIIVPSPSEPTTFSGFTIRGRFGTGRASPLFYAHFFKSRDFADIIKTVGRGANIRNLSQGILSRLKVPLPPIATQEAIVAEVEAERALVGANRELISRFEKKIQATLARLWGEAPAAEPPDNPKKIKDSKPQPVAA